jgi:hypothetical protein
MWNCNLKKILCGSPEEDEVGGPCSMKRKIVKIMKHYIRKPDRRRPAGIPKSMWDSDTKEIRL